MSMHSLALQAILRTNCSPLVIYCFNKICFLGQFYIHNRNEHEVQISHVPPYPFFFSEVLSLYNILPAQQWMIFFLSPSDHFRVKVNSCHPLPKTSQCLPSSLRNRIWSPYQGTANWHATSSLYSTALSGLLLQLHKPTVVSQICFGLMVVFFSNKL